MGQFPDTQEAATPAALTPELEPLVEGDPDRIGPFRIVGRLGSGGMGTVYGGVDVSGRCLAVETVHESYAAHAAFREVFSREVELLRRVDGVCVPVVRAANPEAEVPWMAVDYAPGRDLRRHLREIGPLGGDMLLSFAAGTAEALAAIHACDVVHGDITPGNVILSPGGPRVVDFIAAAIGGRGGQEDSAALGTPGWTAPECYDSTPASDASDVFAWGALVALAASGREPFGAGSASELKHRVQHDEPEVDGLPEELRDLVARALAKDPQARPSAEEALRGLIPRITDESPEAVQSRTSLRGLVRGALALRWRGIDAAGHHPGTWASLGGVVGVAGADAGAAEGGEGGDGEAAGARSAKDESGGGPGGAATRGAANMVALVTAGAIVAAALGLGSYRAYEARADPSEPEAAESPNPSPVGPSSRTAILEAADLVLSAESFQAETVAKDVSSEADTVVETITHQFTGGPDSAYVSRIEGEAEGEDSSPSFVRTGDGDLLAYSADDEEWTRNPEFDSEYDFPGQDRYSPEELVAPLLAMAEADDLTVLTEEPLDDVVTVVYTGTVDVPPSAGEPGEDDQGAREPAPEEFQVRIDERGYPVRHFYANGDLEIRTEYQSFNEPVRLGFPWNELPDDLGTIPDAES